MCLRNLSSTMLLWGRGWKRQCLVMGEENKCNKETKGRKYSLEGYVRGLIIYMHIHRHTHMTQMSVETKR